MSNGSYHIYHFVDKNGTIEWLKIKNYGEALTWQWCLSVSNATIFNSVSEAENYTKKCCKAFDNKEYGIIYLEPEITLTIKNFYYNQELLKDITRKKDNNG